jgi:density-regulated protein DRP1
MIKTRTKLVSDQFVNIFNLTVNKKVAAEAEGKELQGGNAKKKSEELVVTITSRSKRKHLTTITGTEHFGVDANALAKTLKKKLASGASVVSKPELAIEMQGDFRKEVFQILNGEDFKVPPESMFLVAEKKKVKYTDL